MKLKVLIISVFFVCSLLPVLIFAQNKVVVIPLTETQAMRPTAETYTITALAYGTAVANGVDMIPVDSGECFLHEMESQSWNHNGVTNTGVYNECYIIQTSSGKWRLVASSGNYEQTVCSVRCLRW